MDSPHFSIITPVWNRVKDGKLKRCLNSLVTQTNSNFQAYIVDDGSSESEEVLKLVESYKDTRLGCLRIPHSGRVIARNLGMEIALRNTQTQWICHLDSDDALDPTYLETLAYHIRSDPEKKVWVIGAVVHGMLKENGRYICPKWTQLRKAWKPPKNPDGPGYLHFPSGHIGTGMFIFHRDCLKKTGLLPNWRSHLEVADGVDDYLGYKTGYSAAERWVGNPWGEDWALCRALSMHFDFGFSEACLYIQYVR